jgi:hypothetical protein
VKYPSIKDIVRQWFALNPQYDGLVNEIAECCCFAGDIDPCGHMSMDCVPGFKCPCDPETCTAEGDCSHHIREPEKGDYDAPIAPRINTSKGGGE